MSYGAKDTGVVITMAGAGSRFAVAGYQTPKYQIEVQGRSLFEWSLDSLRSFIDAGCRFYFVTRREDQAETFIDEKCEELGIRGFEVMALEEMTDGQATTALMVGTMWDDPSRPVGIYNIDTWVRPEYLAIESVCGAGWVPCFPGDGDKWSFARTDDTGRVVELREKKRISPHATVGFYWFDSFQRYTRAYRKVYASPERTEAKERYIAPMYNQLIGDGAPVCLHLIPTEAVYPLGTPEDVQQFAALPDVCWQDRRTVTETA